MTGIILNPGAGPIGGDASYADACLPGISPEQFKTLRKKAAQL
jgi:hypothetical protein